MLLGYARVSTLEQNLDRQIDALVNAGVDPRMIYQEKITGTKLQRPELNRLLEDLQPGDVLIIPDLTRISRSTNNQFLLTVMIGISQLERDLVVQRTKEGLASAKARGRKGGRPSCPNAKKDTVRILAENGMRIVDIVRETGLSRSTVNRILKEDSQRLD